MSRLAATWWGHSTVTVEIDGRRLLTDPVLTGRLAHLRRHGRAPGPEALWADAVAVSHLHLDHFHVASLRRLPRGTTVLVPRNGGRLLRGAGLDVDEVRPGDVGSVGGVRLEATPAVHSDRRHHGSRLRGEPLGFVIRGDREAVWYPGDTALGDHLDDVSGIDLALVPIGGWGPSLGEGHLDPAAAVEAVRRTGARQVLPVHWGTFWPAGLRRWPRLHERWFQQPGRQFAQQLGSAARLLRPPHGERIEGQDTRG